MNVVNYDFGVDLNSSLSFTDGDLDLCKYDDNIIQAICNRLNTDLNELELFYKDYGSVMLGFLGWKSNENTLNVVKSELQTILKNEKRISNWEYEVYYKNNVLTIELIVYPNNSDYSINAIFELTNNGVEIIGE